jgi:ParB family transcriptional regulator, chromosome partitioning protein
MNARKNALGRGLGALIEGANVTKEIVQAVEANNEIELSLIDVNPFQPRQNFDEEELQELAISIKQLGVVQPVTLRQLENGRYQLIAGERRVRAAKIAKLEFIPAFVRSADDQGMLEMALVENIHRTDLNPIEVAVSYQRLVDECNLTQESLSDRVGKKRSTIANYLRLLKLPAEILLGLREEKITMGHAKALISVEDADKQVEVFHKAISKNLSVREVEELVRTLAEGSKADSKKKSGKSVDSETNRDYEVLQQHLSKYFNSPVEFKRNSKGAGKIIINFKTDEELERIVSVLDKK